MKQKLFSICLIALFMTACSSNNELPNTYTIGRLPKGAGFVLCVEGYKFHYINGFSQKYLQVMELDEHGNERPVQCKREDKQ